MRRLLLLLVTLAPIACSGAQRNSDADWTPDPQPKGRRFRETEALHAADLDPLEGRSRAPLGVRHDLMLSKGPHQARCNCLAVEVGPSRDKAKFFWVGSPPDTGHDATVVAIGANGVACPNGPPDERLRRPSISAVDFDGEDVIVEIESLAEGRPLASGAIIPKPGARGGIFIRPHRNNPIYGRSPGVSRCRVR
jgi:hypothetical protein